MLPAEWERQAAIIVAWPHNETDWADSMCRIEPVYSRIVSSICQFQKVILICKNSSHKEHIRQYLYEYGNNSDRVEFHEITVNDTWVRDYGPLTIYRDQRLTWLNFIFNGWGNRYPAALDNQVTQTLFECSIPDNTELHTIDYILEGGSIESDGLGTILTTESCLLNTTRNGSISKDFLQKKLAKWFGTKRVLWLKNGYLAGDDTDSHIDNLARFCGQSIIAHSVCMDSSDEHYNQLVAMQAELESFRQSNGEPYTLIPLPIPAPIHDTEGQRLPASYANFLIINGAVLVPEFDDPNDVIARQRIASVFPKREIIAIDSRELIQQHGGIHCMSMQLPLSPNYD